MIMFINPSIFKKMAKSAFEHGGLSVARTKEHYVIAGNYWCVRVKPEAFPAKARAAVVELTSEFPAIGEKYIAYKHEDKQWDCFNGSWRWCDEGEEQTLNGKERKPVPTCIYIGGLTPFRMWQTEEDTEPLFIPQATDGLVSTKFIELTCETAPSEPVSLWAENEIVDEVYWKNNCCELWITASKKLADGQGEDALFETELLGSYRWQQAMTIR